MSMFPTKILLAVDGSAEAESAVRAAIELSSKTKSELHVVHVAPLPGRLHVPENLEQMEETAERMGCKTPDEQLQRIEEMGGEVAEAHVGIGRPDAEIVRTGEEIDAGLIVIGSRGIDFMRRALLGSVPESTVHHAHCPVLVTRPQESEEGFLKSKILVATDYSDEAGTAVETAVELADATGSELHLIHALPVEPPTPFPYPYDRQATERWEAWWEQAKKKSRTFVEERAERIGSESGISVRPHLRFGRPGHEIVELGEELDAGLVIVGSRGLGGVRRVQMGSVSDAVVRHAHSAVLVVRQ
ncbi:MAG: universal stress protein [Rubrobacteraceae bacterium]